MNPISPGIVSLNPLYRGIGNPDGISELTEYRINLDSVLTHSKVAYQGQGQKF